MDQAARKGDLAEVQRLYAAGAPWTTFTCIYAVIGGHLDILKWAHANGCPWNKAACLERHLPDNIRAWILSGAGDHGCLQQAIAKSAAPRRAARPSQ